MCSNETSMRSRRRFSTSHFLICNEQNPEISQLIEFTMNILSIAGHIHCIQLSYIYIYIYIYIYLYIYMCVCVHSSQNMARLNFLECKNVRRICESIASDHYGIWCWSLLALEWTPIFTSQSIVFSLYSIVGVGVTGPPLSTNWSGRVLQAISSVMRLGVHTNKKKHGRNI